MTEVTKRIPKARVSSGAWAAILALLSLGGPSQAAETAPEGWWVVMDGKHGLLGTPGMSSGSVWHITRKSWDIFTPGQTPESTGWVLKPLGNALHQAWVSKQPVTITARSDGKIDLMIGEGGLAVSATARAATPAEVKAVARAEEARGSATASLCQRALRCCEATFPKDKVRECSSLVPKSGDDACKMVIELTVDSLKAHKSNVPSACSLP